MARYFCQTLIPAPVLASPQNPFRLPLPKDSQGRILAIETILPKGATVEVIGRVGEFSEILSSDYTSTTPLYIDSKLLRETRAAPSPQPPLISASALLEKLTSLLGTRYFWGGTHPEGIPELHSFYPELQAVGEEDRDDSLCKGVDCSGFLRWATGYTPHSTSQLLSFGEEVLWEGLTEEELAAKVKPLDLIVWKGHVIIVKDEKSVIESSLTLGGVVERSLLERFTFAKEIAAREGKQLYLRRWHYSLF